MELRYEESPWQPGRKQGPSDVTSSDVGDTTSCLLSRYDRSENSTAAADKERQLVWEAAVLLKSISQPD
ncbi:Hypothetical protein SMAX5B_004749 [Scophthalmus maximus]|uniref:Uncharacterized protein n=1 Tax=Scophthalmus maximus TaxID=52904 RepID=A0A2U9B6S8_SCOMX|nr:Hypothetical protein SMAX5B_004749 [Scophthalmus maximus]